MLHTGLFLPVANRNWVMAISGPEDPATFANNLRLTRWAEAIGMDFVLAQSVWRGHGGVTKFWDESLECLTLGAALAASTSRIGIVSSIMPALYPPAVAAKMASTIDDISGGRFAFNLVAGANLREFEQMGVLPEEWPSVKYDYAAEWLSVLRRLWSEDRVTHHGKWFDLHDCVSGPVPAGGSVPIVCAGASAPGMAFTAAHATHAFVGGPPVAGIGQLAADYKAAAAGLGRSLHVYTVLTVVLEESIDAGEERLARYEAEPDVEAILDHHGEYSRPVAGESLRRRAQDVPPVWFGRRPDPVTPSMLVDQFEELHEAGVDGVLCSCTDWDTDLTLLERSVLPILRDRGVVAPLPGARWGS